MIKTAEEFIARYARERHVTIEWLQERGFIGIPVDASECEYEGCEDFHLGVDVERLRRWVSGNQG